MSTPPEAHGKREQTKARNRGVILDAARQVFSEIGYDAASIRDIVARTDLAPGTFYNYFPDKQSVLMALCSESTAEVSRRLRAARARASTLSELSYEGFRVYFQYVAEERVMFNLLRRNAATLRSFGVDATGFAQGVDDLRADLEMAIQSGRLPPLPMNYVPQVIAAVAFEVATSMAQEETPDVEGATRFAAELCMGGLSRLSMLGLAQQSDPTKAKGRPVQKSKKARSLKSKKTSR